jgi:uncharacterized membrane protein
VRRSLAPRGAGRSAGHPALRGPQIAVGLLVAAYLLIFGTLALRRHQNLHTNALDLGYTDQAVWNTLRGRPFRFSTYLDAAFRLDIPIQDFREPGVLLGYHVEPVLVAISLLYLLHDGPETLLWLQTAGIALGAVPVYLLARHRFEQRGANHASRFALYILRWLPVAFVLLYLLSPSLEAANLSDFHAVVLSPALLLSAFYSLETDRPWGFLIFAFLATMCKEEVGLVVAMLGLWAAIVRRRWALGLGTVVAAAGWSLLCFLAIAPHFNGLTASAFTVRYRQFGDTPAGIVRNLMRQPGLLVDWLRQPDVLRYLRDLWLSSGGLAVLYPLSLAMALPLVAINAFSIYGWMRSGGGHYSALIVPFLIISAIYGVDWVARRAAHSKWPILNLRLRLNLKARTTHPESWIYAGASLALVGLGLAVALVYHYQNGISPLSRRFALEPLTEHARRADPFFERINGLPPDVAISASSGLYPHVGHRERAYLFPTISDAQFILLDVTGPTSPTGAGEQRLVVRELLDYAQFGVAASDHGFLLLERDLDRYLLSPSFYDVFEAGSSVPQVPLGADFGGLLRLEGFDWNVRSVVRPELVVEITTFWRALSPLEEEYRLVFYFWDGDGRLIRVQPEEILLHWYPTWQWEPDQVMRATLPALPVGDLAHVGVAVLRPGAGDRDIQGRVVPIAPAGGQVLSLWEQDTILELVKP